MEKVTKRFDGLNCAADNHAFNQIKNAMTEDPRLCPEHGESVSVKAEHHGSPNPEVPNIEVVFSGCCYEAIDKEVEFRRKVLMQSGRYGR
jgi:hypothetical protein